MWGKSKKKLAAINTLIDAANQDINSRNAELTKLTSDIESCAKETEQIRASTEAERSEQKRIEAENASLLQEIDRLNGETADLQQQIAASKAAADEARREKEDLARQLAEHEQVVCKEHSAAEAAAEAAVKQAENLQAEQEAERRRWQDVRDAHEELRRQVEAGQRQCEEAKAARDTARGEWVSARDEVRELRLAHSRLNEEVQRTEESLAGQQAQRKRLQEELVSLGEQHRHVLAATKVLEEDHRQRQFVLQTVSQNLDEKRGQLQRELTDFQEKFQRAKEQHEQVVAEQGPVQEAMSSLLPEYFQLQTDRAARGRELEQARCEHELLNWEHHKVQRDVRMLAASYDPSQPPVASGPP